MDRRKRTVGTSLYEYIFENKNRILRDEPLLVDAETPSRAFTFDAIRARVQAFATVLQKDYGLAPGDVVAIVSPNDIEYPIVMHGIIAAGVIACPATITQSAEELAYVFSLARPKLVVAHATNLRAIAQVITLSSKCLHRRLSLITLGPDTVSGVPSFKSLVDKQLRQKSTGSDLWRNLHRPADIDQIAYLATTAGTTSTTGRPFRKVVAVSHRAAMGRSNEVVKHVYAPNNTRKLYHCVNMAFSSVINFFHFAAIQAGIQQHVSSLDTPAERLAHYLRSTAADTAFLSAPTLIDLTGLCDTHLDFGPKLHLIISGGQFVSPTILGAIRDRLQVMVLHSYGSTEAARPFIWNHSGEITGAAGKLNNEYYHVKIVDQDGQEVAAGQSGELHIKSLTMCEGYFNNPELTSRVFDKDGYYRSGDLFVKDTEGNYTYIDRISNMILTKNGWVPPTTIASICQKFSNNIKECYVVGELLDSQPVYRVPKAYIVLHKPVENKSEVEQEIVRFVKAHAPHPGMLLGAGSEIIDRIPRTKAGKIDQLQLEDKKRLHPHDIKHLKISKF